MYLGRLGLDYILNDANDCQTLITQTLKPFPRMYFLIFLLFNETLLFNIFSQVKKQIPTQFCYLPLNDKMRCFKIEKLKKKICRVLENEEENIFEKIELDTYS